MKRNDGTFRIESAVTVPWLDQDKCQAAVHQPSSDSSGGLTVTGRETGVTFRWGSDRDRGAQIEAIEPFGPGSTTGTGDSSGAATLCEVRRVEGGGESGLTWS